MHSAGDNPPSDARNSLIFQLLSEVGILSQLSHNRASRRLSPDLNMAQFVVLNHFARLGQACSLTRLARALEVSNGAVTNTVSRLQRKGYLAVRPDPDDGRGKLAALTPQGREAHGRAVAILSADLAPLAAMLSKAELEAAVLALQKARTWFDQNR